LTTLTIGKQRRDTFSDAKSAKTNQPDGAQQAPEKSDSDRPSEKVKPSPPHFILGSEKQDE
jgi:hypothetical protein